jgi:putative component of membrane protein insertase Oxa1/YidC/SpoIIIJ protein YidD
MRQVVIQSIGIYQRHLSPLKGYCCAHNYLHRNGSCSQFAMRAVTKYGVVKMLGLLRLRFKACALAYQHIQEARKETEEESSKRYRTPTRSDLLLCLPDAACCFLS